jgi:hypothetical protein
MTTTDRPKLSLEVRFQIETAQNQIHLKYRTLIQQMQVPTEEAEAERLKFYPTIKYNPPMLKSPQSLRLMIAQYSSFLFESEVTFYPNDPQLEHWLEKLAERIHGAVLETVVKLQQVGVARKITLMYHGVTFPEMRETISETLREDIERHLRRRMASVMVNDPSPAAIQIPQPATITQQDVYNETARHLMGEPRREETTDAVIQSSASAREQFIKPLLLKRGWSVLDWALEAEVAYNTAAGYVAGKKTYASTRFKLAKALGLEANQLPE